MTHDQRLYRMTRFCSLPEIVDQHLVHQINECGFILELDEGSPTYSLCKEMAETVAGLLNNLQSILPRRERVRDIHWGFVESREPRAFSTVVTSAPAPYEFIALSHGSIAAAMDQFNRIFAHPVNFPAVGDPSKEEAPPPGEISVRPLIDADWRKWVVPRCPVRQCVARNLTILCLVSIVLHEFSHLANGHVDYLMSIGNPKEPLLMQTLEMDADSASIRRAIEFTEARRKYIVEREWPNSNFMAAQRIAFGSPRQCFNSILIAGYVFFRMFKKPWDPKSQPGNTHPQAAIRMKFLSDGLQENMRNCPVPGYDEKLFNVDAARAFESIDKAFAMMEGCEPNRDIWASAFRAAEAPEYFYTLERKYAEIRPELEKVMKIESMPPIDWTRIPR